MATEEITESELSKYQKDGRTLPQGYIFKYTGEDNSSSIEILEKLGNGTFGITYKGQRTYFLKSKGGMIPRKDFIAIKEFMPQNLCTRQDDLSIKVVSELEFNKYKTRFENEAKILQNHQGNNVVRARGFFEENNTSYYYMDFIKGHCLKDYIENKGNFSQFKDVWHFLKPLCENLIEIHQSIIHTDISYNNIMINEENGREHPILIDFGSCSIIEKNKTGGNLTQHQTWQSYFSPLEICNISLYNNKYQNNPCKVISPSVDIYAIGLIMFYMMQPDFFTDINMPMWMTLQDVNCFPKDMEPVAKNVIQKACAERIEDRPQNMEEFIKICDEAIVSITPETIININPPITIKELLESKNKQLTITLPLDDVTLNSIIIKGYSWRDFLIGKDLTTYDFKVGEKEFKRITIKTEDDEGKYKLTVL